MHSFLMAVFWSSVLLLAYAYLLYPLLVWILAALFRRPRGAPKNAAVPRMTLIVSAYNEERLIDRKVGNCVDLMARSPLLQTIVVSDGSTDATNVILTKHRSASLRVIERRERRGKASALNLAMEQADGDIVVFSDANVLFEADAVERLAVHFADSEVGAVTGRTRLIDPAAREPLGEGVYMRLEWFVARQESALCTAVAPDGAMFAVRRELVSHIPEDIILDDLYIALCVVSQGKRIVFAEDALATETVVASVSNEFKRKSRIASGGFQVLGRFNWARMARRRPSYVALFVSHKLLRWATPVPLIAVFVSSALLTNERDFGWFLALQAGFYGSAFVGYLLPGARKRAVVYYPYYLTTIWLAMAKGLADFLRGSHTVTWQSAR